MTQLRSTPVVRAATIGLIGSLLTVCGGLSGALISASVTIYQVERGQQQIDLAASEAEQALSIDTGGIFISRQEAAALDPEEYFVDLDRGIAIRRPLPGWGELEELTLGEQMAEDSTAVPSPPLSEQPVYRIRYGERVEMQFDRSTLVNGQPLPPAMAEIMEQLYGSEPWTIPYYSAVVVNVFERPVVADLGMTGLPDLFLTMMRYSSGRANRLLAPEDADTIIVQTSASYQGVQVAGQSMTITLEDWSLFAESEDAYYVIEITYIPQAGHSVQAWDDLQTYMDSFRVIR